jgi:hypothetical protein
MSRLVRPSRQAVLETVVGCFRGKADSGADLDGRAVVGPQFLILLDVLTRATLLPETAHNGSQALAL